MTSQFNASLGVLPLSYRRLVEARPSNQVLCLQYCLYPQNRIQSGDDSCKAEVCCVFL